MATIISRSPEETFAFGVALAASLRAGDVVGLIGDLGAGKTQFVKGIARGLGCAGEVTSPTFTLIHEYAGGRVPLFHIDLYRLESADEATGIGLEEYLSSSGITVIEWADKFPDLLPAETRWIRFAISDGDERQIEHG